MNTFKVEIVFVDGTTELVENVNQVTANDGVIRLYRVGGWPYKLTNCGSYPLANIKRWREGVE